MSRHFYMIDVGLYCSPLYHLDVACLCGNPRPKAYHLCGIHVHLLWEKIQGKRGILRNRARVVS